MISLLFLLPFRLVSFLYLNLGYLWVFQLNSATVKHTGHPVFMHSCIYDNTIEIRKQKDSICFSGSEVAFLDYTPETNGSSKTKKKIWIQFLFFNSKNWIISNFRSPWGQRAQRADINMVMNNMKYRYDCLLLES